MSNKEISGKGSVLSSLQNFIKSESLSGVLLLAATIIALIWANSAWGETYNAIWQYELGFSFDVFELKKPLILWINDGLMAIFFFVIGLEVKRELTIGELNSPKKIAFPLYGALGGMIIPALFYYFINSNPETAGGWGIPMATDIAFALAVLKILGDKIPLSLKVFLTAFAIVDDLGAVMVIAIFYSDNIQISLLIIASILLLILFFLTYRNLYSKSVLIVVGLVVWVLFLKSGIHPTLAGVLLAFAVPLRQKVDASLFIKNLETITGELKLAEDTKDPVLSSGQLMQIDNLEKWTLKFRSPLQHLEHSLHTVVGNFIIPVFALANAGVMLNSEYDLNFVLITTLVASLVLGKSVGVSGIVFLVKKLKIVQIPKEINNMHIIGVSFLAGIGFTMAIFIASLAFGNSPEYIDSAKIGILIGSLVSAVIGFVILKLNSNKKQ